MSRADCVTWIFFWLAVALNGALLVLMVASSIGWALALSGALGEGG